MSIAEPLAQVRKRTDAEVKLIAAAADLLGEVGPRAMSVRMVAICSELRLSVGYPALRR